MVSPAFNQLVGQLAASELLSQAIERQRVAPAYLFTGPEGVGRALAARQFALALLNPRGSEAIARQVVHRNHPDLLWLEPTYLYQGKQVPASQLAASDRPRARPQIRLEQIRELVRFLSRPPLEAPQALVVLEQAETMAEAAANGLLKTLEEPGAATLVLIAPSEEALLATLVSRCQRIAFTRLTTAQMQQVLSQACPEVLSQPAILELADGSPGAAIAHWQQLQSLPTDLIERCCQLPDQPRFALELAQQIQQNLDLESQLWLTGYLQHHLWGQTEQPAPLQIQRLQILEQTRQRLLGYVQPQLVWEVAYLELMKTHPTC
jgi:DNA polymerase III subunit delta'